MKVVRDLQERVSSPTVWGIGVFDGIHLGHQALFRRVIEQAKELQATPGLLTFEPHPMEVIRATPIPRLTTLEEKLELIEAAGIDRVWVLTFNHEMEHMTPDEFLDQYLIQASDTRGAVVGFDFTFGVEAKGDAKTMADWGQQRNIRVAVVPAVKSGETKIGSSVIRELVGAGEMEKARALLGRPYSLTGEVVQGDQRGQTLGFPTLNLRVPEEKLLPGRGVYIVRVRVEGPAAQGVYSGVCNIGFRPTFRGQGEAGEKPVIEAFADGLEGDLYGARVRLDLCKYLRAERKFDNIDMLKRQIHDDVEEMKQYEYSEAG